MRKGKFIGTEELTITSSYVGKQRDGSNGWGIPEGFREYVQEMLDSNTRGNPPFYSYNNGTVLIGNEGVSIGIEKLLLGETDKVDDSNLRGEKGEGFKLGTMVLLRAGLKVEIDFGRVIAVPHLSESLMAKKYLESGIATCAPETIQMDLYERPEDLDVQVMYEVKGLDKPTWTEIKKNFLFFNKPDPEQMISCKGGDILLEKKFAKKLFCKGIFVTDLASEYTLGYDINHKDMKLDRDRKMTDEWKLKSILAEVLKDGLLKSSEVLGPIVYKMMTKSAPEVSKMSWHYVDYQGHANSKKVLAGLFKKEYGENAIPVMTMEASRAVTRAGFKGIIVKEELFNTISDEFFSAQEKLKQSMEAARTFSWGDLKEREQKVLEKAVAIVQKAAPEMTLERVNVIKFKTPKGVTRWGGLNHGVGEKIEIDRACLKTLKEAVKILVHEVAHDKGEDFTVEHTREIERIWSDLIDLS